MKRRDKIYIFSFVLTVSIFLNIKAYLYVDVPYLSMPIGGIIGYIIFRYLNKKNIMVVKEKCVA